ncbi:hypothetical protein [Ensifer sp. SSB1]|jgi:predicted transcriptional regulator|uniref:winged helix-turn-helix domain-containing protein n=1 Tax=Ensifer sp. SSB1 TaxID=2795385 RepID=UPI001A53AAAA|nr:hypothetical protein [Ensifer sp. SSB1]MBK5569469.1 hypothetical protein [Ensifer sp. SSB1]
MRKHITDLILSGEIMNYGKWLSTVVGELASSIDGLDNMSPIAMLPLAGIAANNGTSASQLAIACDMELTEVEKQIDALCEFGFITNVDDTFNLTTKGEKTFNAFGRSMILYEKFQLGRRKEEVDRISKIINDVAEF